MRGVKNFSFFEGGIQLSCAPKISKKSLKLVKIAYVAQFTVNCADSGEKVPPLPVSEIISKKGDERIVGSGTFFKVTLRFTALGTQNAISLMRADHPFFQIKGKSPF